jgi:hypothetical protein
VATLAMVVLSFAAIAAVFLVLQRGEQDESEEPAEDGDNEGFPRTGRVCLRPQAAATGKCAVDSAFAP